VFAKTLNSNYKVTDLRKNPNHNLFELNLDTMNIDQVCSLSDIQTGKTYPKIASERLYVFRLNYKNAIKGYKKAINEVINVLNL
jgi:hypothetical protein